MNNSSTIRRFQAAAPASAHGMDKPRSVVKVFRIKVAPDSSVRFEQVSSKEFNRRAALVQMAEEQADTPALQAQIRASFEAYLDGDARPVDEFLAELEAELDEQ